MPDLFDDVIPIVKGAINKLRHFLMTSVKEFPSLTEEDWWDYARLIAVELVTSRCTCERANCPREHNLSAWDPNTHPLATFLYRAVIGPAGLKPISIGQGMLFPHLHEEYGLLLAKVGFKQCTTDRCTRPRQEGSFHKTIYEGTKCPYCGEAFDPTVTPVVARDWLIIQESYVTSRWWACGRDRHAHYYLQHHCNEIFRCTPETHLEPSYRVAPHHDIQNTHDCCPLLHCERQSLRHGRRGTTLWQRATFTREEHASTPLPPFFLDSVIEGVSNAIRNFDGWKYIWLLYIIRCDPEKFPKGEGWKAVLEGGRELTDNEKIALADELLSSRVVGSIFHADALQQLAANAATIARDLGFPEDLQFPPKALEVKHFEANELRPQLQSVILRALRARGIHNVEEAQSLRGI